MIEGIEEVDSNHRANEEEEVQRGLLQAAVGEDYEILDSIGHGGFGIVYRASERKLRRQVAIKVLRPELFDSKAARSRFRLEAQAAASLRHPNVIPIFAVGDNSDIAYIVMPLINGESLGDVLAREGRLSIVEARRVIIETADALQCAHEAGIIHRDIKPQNIMLEGTARRVLLMDFGIARLTSSDFGTLTGTGVVIGTPAYMSPEQAGGGEDLDARSDIYSLGVVAYRILTGELPFDGTTAHEIIVRHLIEVPKNPAVRRLDVPSDMAAAVMRCLAKNPVKRWASAHELSLAITPRGDSALPQGVRESTMTPAIRPVSQAASLTSVRGDVAAQPSSPPLPSSARQRPTERSRAMPPIAAAGLLALVLIIYLLLRTTGAGPSRTQTGAISKHAGSPSSQEPAIDSPSSNLDRVEARSIDSILATLDRDADAMGNAIRLFGDRVPVYEAGIRRGEWNCIGLTAAHDSLENALDSYSFEKVLLGQFGVKSLDTTRYRREQRLSASIQTVERYYSYSSCRN